jgi:hypothetical protein
VLALLDCLVEVGYERVVMQRVPRPKGEIAHVLDGKGEASGSVSPMVMQNVIHGDKLGSEAILKVAVKLCQLANDEVVQVFDVFMAETWNVRNFEAEV